MEDNNNEFKIGEQVVYPSHGLGVVSDIAVQEIAGVELSVYVISFARERMSITVPVKKAITSGLRKLVSKSNIKNVYKTLMEKPKRGNKMWSRRAQEYELKINSGDIVLIAEVIRDLYKSSDQDRSYSERKIFETAFERVSSEIASATEVSVEETSNHMTQLLKDKMLHSEDSLLTA